MTELNNQPQQQQTTIIVQQQSNAVGTAGFVLAIIGLICSWVPGLGWIIWILGLILSFAGLFNKPRGLAVAGIVVSFIGIILILIITAGIFAAAVSR